MLALSYANGTTAAGYTVTLPSTALTVSAPAQPTPGGGLLQPPVQAAIQTALQSALQSTTAAGAAASQGVGAWSALSLQGPMRNGLSVAPLTRNVAFAPPALAAAFGGSTGLRIVSAPGGTEPSQGVTMSQARWLMSGDNGAGGADGSADVRVPLGRNSVAELVNGGVRLPSGVDQLLFVVKAQ